MKLRTHCSYLIIMAAAALAVACSSEKKSSSDQAQPAPGTETQAAPQKRTLVINTNTSDPAPKQGFEELIAAFKAENPDIEVKFNVFDHEGYKTAIRNFLSSNAPDVVTWFAGNRMRVFVDRQLFEDVSDVWQESQLGDKMASSQPALTINGKQWGVPYTSYQWGIFYRKDLFDQHGLSEPKTWEEFLAVCKTLKEKGISPIAIGTKFPWTTAGWFDYLNLRINGYDFHMELTAGKVPYTDERLKPVFAKWRELVDPGYFIENHATYSWQEAQPFFFTGKAAMYLIGNFLVPNIPADVIDKVDFFPFPVINAQIPMAEDAPIDTVHIPAKAKNKADARKFLAFVARTENQGKLNQTLKQLPPHKEAAVAEDRFLKEGAALLSAAKALAQFYDRDTHPEMAKVGMDGFQEFMIKPDRLGEILERLEATRQRAFAQPEDL